jgi:hypothetical protein
MEWITPVGSAMELAMSRVSDALERIELIGRTPGSPQDRYRSAGIAIGRFADLSHAWHKRFGSFDTEALVRGELGELERAVARRLGAFEGAPEDRVGLLLERLVACFPHYAR